MARLKDLTGEVFGSWTVISRAGKKGNNPTWHCKCVCGAEKEVQGRHLNNGQSTSCGCSRIGEKRKKKDLTGVKFGRWFVLNLSNKDIYGDTYWDCECECGTKRSVLASSLKSGVSKSCGCILKEIHSNRAKHGHNRVGKRTTTYQTWVDMKRRCEDVNHRGYHNYGGKGVAVCKRWQKFDNFLSDMGERPSGKSLDRIDNSKGYNKENCRWATQKQQMNNMSRNHYLTYKGETKTIAQWADSIGLKYETLNGRIHRGWSIDRALETPTKKADYD